MTSVANAIAIVVAGIVGFVVGGIWYRALGKPWMAAHGFTQEMVRAHHGKGAPIWPMLIAFLANLVMAVVLSGLIWHINAFTVRAGMISGAFVWAGFVITTLTVNNTFGMRSPKLIAIDGGYWLIALLLMGAIIGGFGY